RSAGGIRIVDPDREHVPRSRVATCDGRRLDQRACLGDSKQVDERVFEVEDRGVLVLVDDLQTEDVLVERPRAAQVLDEQRDRTEALQRVSHSCLLFWLFRRDCPGLEKSSVTSGPGRRVPGMNLLAMTQHQGVRWEEIGFAVGAIGGVMIALGSTLPMSRRSGNLLGGLALATGFVLAIIGVHYGQLS